MNWPKKQTESFIGISLCARQREVDIIVVQNQKRPEPKSRPLYLIEVAEPADSYQHLIDIVP